MIFKLRTLENNFKNVENVVTAKVEALLNILDQNHTKTMGMDCTLLQQVSMSVLFLTPLQIQVLSDQMIYLRLLDICCSDVDQCY